MFHVALDGETALGYRAGVTEIDEFSLGFFLGLLVGEGHFGGDGKQPQITLRMHVRHEQTFRWIERTFPGGKLYGPYDHGGRRYFQWMARGPYLRDVIMPLVATRLAHFDAHVRARVEHMCAVYRIPLAVTELSPPAAPSRGSQRT